MALIFNGNLPKISGNIKIEVPTPTYSGTASSNANDSINPYTSQGPGAGGAGQTESEIAADRTGEVLDPDFNNVSLVMNYDGETNGSTVFTDGSSNNHTFAGFGSAVISTAQNKLGDGSLDLTAASAYIATPSDSSLHLTDQPFTIEGFARWTSAASGTNTLISMWGDGLSNLQFSLSFETNGLSFRHSNGSDFPVLNFVWTPNQNQWYHLAVNRDASNDVNLYIDGVEVATTNFSTRSLNATVMELRIGADGVGRFFPGYLDGMRMTVGTSRYDEAFTPPTAAFPTS